MARPTALAIVAAAGFQHARGRPQHPPGRDPPLEQERAAPPLQRFAALAFARANLIDRLVFAGGPTPKIGIITTGKSYLDVLQALDELGIDEVEAQPARPPASTRSAWSGRSIRDRRATLPHGLDL